MKYLILVGDGMGDYPISEIENKTPLEYAKTPFMDSLCKKSALFPVCTVPEGFTPGSDIANMSLLGYDPARYYTGRAPLEAAAMGIELGEDDIAYRCNMVTLSFLFSAAERGAENAVTMTDFSAGHITTAEAKEIIDTLMKEGRFGDEFRFYPGVSYRNLMVYRGEKPEFATVPPHDYIGRNVLEFWQSYLVDEKFGQLTAEILRTLCRHPVNRKRLEEGLLPCTSFWLWGEGKRPDMPTLSARLGRAQAGFSGTMISAVDLLKGLGVFAGLDTPDIEGATAYIDTNYEGKAAAALAALEQEDFVFVHLEAPDESGHNGRLDHKIQAIEDFDQKIVKRIIEELHRRGEEFRAVVTMDHFTPLSLRTHSADPVPVLLYDSRNEEGGSGLPFNEAACIESSKQGAKLLEDGYKLIDILFENDGK